MSHDAAPRTHLHCFENGFDDLPCRSPHVEDNSEAFFSYIITKIVKRHRNSDILETQNVAVLFILFFFLIQFNVPFKIISLILSRANRKLGRNGSTPGKLPDTPASRTWLDSQMVSAGLEPTPVTAVRCSNY